MDEIVIFEGADLAQLKAWMADVALDNSGPGVRSLRFCVDAGHLKVKVGGGVWSPPLGKLAPESRR